MPEADRRTFTLLELARIAAGGPPVDPADDEIGDPIGRGEAADRRAYGEILAAVGALSAATGTWSTDQEAGRRRDDGEPSVR